MTRNKQCCDDRLKEAVIIAFLLLVMVIVHDMDFEDQVQELNNYCEHVRSNAWPDYNPNTNCEEVALND